MLDHARLLDLRLEPRTCTWDERDVMLYALGIGMCPDGLDRRELRFVTERDLQVLPSFATAICLGAMPGAADLQCDPVRLLHASQGLTLHRPLHPSGRAIVRSAITAAFDKGAKGALVMVETTLTDAADGAALATLNSSMFALDGGGIGGDAGRAPEPAPVPARPPDLSVEITTRPDQALLYRLSGDMNPLHSDPDEARRVGFDRPILHGLCTYGIGMRAILAAFADYHPARIAEYSVRFAAPVFPGETLRFDMWHEGDDVRWEGHVPQRDLVVLRNGTARILPG